MTELELANELKKMYNRGIDKKEQTTMIHLFGVMYAKIIRDNGFILRNILKHAEMPGSYQAEINKGMKLAKYVVAK